MAANVSVRSFLDSFNRKIEEPVRHHLKNVYACVAMSTVTAALGAYVDIYTNILSGNILTILAGLAFLIALHFTRDDGKNRGMRLGFLLGFSFCTGLGLGPLIEQVVGINPSIIPTAFFSTAIIFVSFSLSSLLAKRGYWLYLGGTIASVLLLLSAVSLAGIFFQSRVFFKAHLYVGLILMCCFVLYDTQLIMEKCRMGDKDFIGHSVELFIDFIGIFRRILILLAEKEDSRDRKKR